MNTLKTMAMAWILLATAACARDDDGALVARAGDHRLTVDEAARLLSGASDLPPQPEVVRALGELWIDYTLLAEAVARDSTLSQVDVTPLVAQTYEQEMVFALRDSMVQPDTTVTDDELRELYASESPGARVRARHILMAYPQGADQTQRDSVRREMEEILERLSAGADFDEIARTRSQDPGSATQGGDLGWFDRTEMVRPFADAAFALEPGETSGVVETPFGYHIIRVEERETPSFDDVREDFRTRIQQERSERAESTYIAGVEDAANVQVVPGAAELVRDLATGLDQPLPRRAGNRALAEFEGGAFTLQEARTFLMTRQPQFRQSLATAPDEAIEDNFLRGLVQRELLVGRAREAGLEPTEEARDSLAEVYRERFREVAVQLGLHPLEVRGSESRAQAVDRVVEERLQAILAGEAQVLPLGGASFVLRGALDARLFSGGIDAAVAEIERLRGPGVAPPGAPGTPGGAAAPPAAGDTGG